MLGEVARIVWSNRRGAAGDALMLTRAPIEERRSWRAKREILLQFFSAQAIDRCARLLHDPGISVVRGRAGGNSCGRVTSMHDPTEGGLATGLWELSEASGCRMEVDLDPDQPFWLPEGKAMCAALGLDPAAAITLGLLLAVNPGMSDDARIRTGRNRPISGGPRGWARGGGGGCAARRGGPARAR